MVIQTLNSLLPPPHRFEIYTNAAFHLPKRLEVGPGNDITHLVNYFPVLAILIDSTLHDILHIHYSTMSIDMLCA